MNLTPRQRIALQWIAAGLQQKEIAGKMGIEVVTVHKLIHRACDSNQCMTVPQLMAKCGAAGVFTAYPVTPPVPSIVRWALGNQGADA